MYLWPGVYLDGEMDFGVRRGYDVVAFLLGNN